MDGVIPDALDALAPHRRADPALQGVLDLRFLADDRLASAGSWTSRKRALGGGTIPIVVGAPKLGRYSMFGTLFARHNVDGTVHRIDRHPTMSVHPTTPDARGRHAPPHRRADRAVDRAARRPADRARSRDGGRGRARRGAGGSPEALLIDIADEAAEARVGALLERMAQAPGAALRGRLVRGRIRAGRFLAGQGRLAGRAPRMPAGAVDRILVVSGSCSPATGAQIAAASGGGFAEVALDPVALIVEGEDGPHARAADRARSPELLNEGRSVVTHSSTGPTTRARRLSRIISRARGARRKTAASRAAARSRAAAGGLLERVLRRAPLRRFVVAGGDTSTAAVKQLGVDALGDGGAPCSPARRSAGRWRRAVTCTAGNSC